MAFNSVNFLLFFGAVFVLYWLVFRKNVRCQNFFLLVVSYFFYGCAGWKMLPVLAIYTVIFWSIGLCMDQRIWWKASVWKVVGVTAGIGLMLYFKCFVYVAHTQDSMLGAAGVSFFTFKLISYILEIGRGKQRPTSDLLTFAIYISFFPCILSGPIDRPSFIKQIESERHFNYHLTVDGFRQFLWGLFKKVVIADKCSLFVNAVWNDIPSTSGSRLLMAALLYSFQIYADFSGYSDMAIGTGKILGFTASKNFDCPYFSRNIAEFWEKWHMSLTSWLRDYVYIPLGGSRVRTGRTVFNIFAVFLLSGLWHGLNWTFLLWGGIHATLFIPLVIKKKGKRCREAIIAQGRALPSIKESGRMLMTFLLVTVAWVMFRSESVGQFFESASGMLHWETLSALPLFLTDPDIRLKSIIVIFMVSLEWLQRDKEHALQLDVIKSLWPRIAIYYALLVMVIFSAQSEHPFIYLQF